MDTADTELIETILDCCQQADPDAWLPKGDARLRSYAWDDAKAVIEWLWLAGYVQMGAVEGTEERAIVLTNAGAKIIGNPNARNALIGRYRREQSNPTLLKQRRAVKETFQDPVQPILRRVILWLNILVFLYGVYLANQRKIPLWDYIQGKQTRAVVQIWDETGLLERADVVRGDWWRLLTACFVHAGILHILMNMYALYVVGRDVEQMYGHVRFLIIYLIAGVGGSCLGIYHASAVVGASGALCGLIGATAVWLLWNRRCMAPQLFSRNMWNLFFVAVLISLMSMHSSVSGAGHLGGAIAGAVAAILMHYQRFARSAFIQMGALVLALLLPVGFVMGLQETIKDKEEWAGAIQQSEKDELEPKYEEFFEIFRELKTLYREEFETVLIRNPERRTDAQIQKALATINKVFPRVETLHREVDALGPYQAEKVEKVRQYMVRRLNDWLTVLGNARESLSQPRKWTHQDEDKVKDLMRVRTNRD